MLSCSHECADVSIVSSAGLIGDLSHQEVLDELGEKPGGVTGIGDTTNIESGLHVVESSRLLHSEVGVDALVKETSTSSVFPERHSSVIAPAGHHCNVRSGHLNATFGGNKTWALWLRLDSSWSLLMP